MAIKVRKRGESDDDSPEGEEPDSSQMEPTGQDPFLETSTRTIAWFSNNPNVIIGILMALILAGGAIYGGIQYMRSQALAASSGVSAALAAFETPVEGSQALQAMKSSDRMPAPTNTFESDEARWQAIYDRASKTLDNYPSAPAAQPARATKAAAALRLGETEEAIKLYEAYLESDAAKEDLPTVQYGLSVAYAERGEYQKAISTLDEMEKAESKVEVFAKYHKALYLEASGKTEKARKAYNEILSNNPKTTYKTDIKRRLALL